MESDEENWLAVSAESQLLQGKLRPLISLARINQYLSKTYGPGVSNTFKQSILLENDSEIVHKKIKEILLTIIRKEIQKNYKLAAVVIPSFTSFRLLLRLTLGAKGMLRLMISSASNWFTYCH